MTQQIDVAYFPDDDFLAIFIGPMPGPVIDIWHISRKEWENQGGE